MSCHNSECVILSVGVAAVATPESKDPSPDKKGRLMLPRFLRQLAAVLLGSLLYFFVLMPHLPPAARHAPFRLDWGLLVLAWICLVLYGLIELVLRFRKP